MMMGVSDEKEEEVTSLTTQGRKPRGVFFLLHLEIKTRLLFVWSRVRHSPRFHPRVPSFYPFSCCKRKGRAAPIDPTSFNDRLLRSGWLGAVEKGWLGGGRSASIDSCLVRVQNRPTLELCGEGNGAKRRLANKVK